MSRSPGARIAGASSSRRICRKAPLFSCIWRTMRPPLPINQPAVGESTTTFALVRKFCVGSMPPRASCSAGGSAYSGRPMPAPAANAWAALSGRYLKSLGSSRPRSAMSWMTLCIAAAAATTCAVVPSKPMGVSGMCMMFSFPMLISTPSAASKTSLIVAPCAPTTTGTADAGTMMTKNPGSRGSAISCSRRNFSTRPRHAPSFCSAWPEMVTMRSLNRRGVSRSVETSIMAPVRSARPRSTAPRS
mmetsp:Transcript_65846/g.189872  ORF Transcript_65846/g.189872 Transcript_65846/m.189872 type:complete len:246 (-) Transcript_65846:108-845(-)